jgi:hypothetical protein
MSGVELGLVASIHSGGSPPTGVAEVLWMVAGGIMAVVAVVMVAKSFKRGPRE